MSLRRLHRRNGSARARGRVASSSVARPSPGVPTLVLLLGVVALATFVALRPFHSLLYYIWPFLGQIFLSLEILSISSYVLVGYFRSDRTSAEAALKYVIYGSAASAAMAYGFSLWFGAIVLMRMRTILADNKVEARLARMAREAA